MRTRIYVLAGIFLSVFLTGCVARNSSSLDMTAPTTARAAAREQVEQEPAGIAFGESSHPGSALPAPVGVTASQGMAIGEIMISWDEIFEAEKYAVYVRDKKNRWMAVGWVDRPPAIISDIRPEEELFYSIAGIDRADREGPWSNAVMGWAASAKQPPVNVRASRGSDPHSVLLTWDAAPGAAGYKIYMSSGHEQYSYLRDWQGTTVRIPVSETGKHYFFKVSMISPDGVESDLSDYSEGWTEAVSYPSPDAPIRLSASDGIGKGEISLHWDQVAGAIKYEIYRATSSVGPFQYLTSVNTTSYTDKNVIPWSGYWYKISAVDSVGRAGVLCNHNEGWARRYKKS